MWTLTWEGSREGGRYEIPMVGVTEADEHGKIERIDLYDPEQLDHARARFRELEAAASPRSFANAATRALELGTAALGARDWDGFAALFAADFTSFDHSSIGHVESGREEWLAGFRQMLEMTSSQPAREVVATRGDRLALARVSWRGGGGDIGPSEVDWLLIIETDERGDHRAVITFDPDQLEAAHAELDARWRAGEGSAHPRVAAYQPALARFSEIGASPADAPLAPGMDVWSRVPEHTTRVAKPNAAAEPFGRWQVAFQAAMDTDEWAALRAACAAGMIFEDRRRLMLLAGDVELLIASARERRRTGAALELQLAGTAGGRVAIWRTLWSGGPPEGRFEIEYLSVTEVDEAGLLAAVIFFDVDDARAAQREAWARWAAVEPVLAGNVALLSRLVDAFNAHDLAAFLATVADDVLVVDHRRTGLGRLEGAPAFGASIEALWSLAPGTTAEAGWHLPAYGPHGVLTVVRRHGTLADGGAYEIDYLQLFVGAGGRFTNIEMFELEDLDKAKSRFEELRPRAEEVPT